MASSLIPPSVPKAFECLCFSVTRRRPRALFLSLLCTWAGRHTLKLDLLLLRWDDEEQRSGSLWTEAVLLLSSCVVLGKSLSLSEALSRHLSEADNKSSLLQALRGLSWIRQVKVLCN